MNAGVERANSRQVSGAYPQALSEILMPGVNLAVWQRHLPPQVEDFAALVVSLQHCLSDERVLDVTEHCAPDLAGLLAGAADLEGYASFLADVAWLVEAFTCLLGARRVGLRVRVLGQAMCPRFHVDQVAIRLLTTYVGVGSEWLPDPADVDNYEWLDAGAVALLKGERWEGNTGGGLVHRSPVPSGTERRLLLSLDWLA